VIRFSYYNKVSFDFISRKVRIQDIFAYVHQMVACRLAVYIINIQCSIHLILIHVGFVLLSL